MNTRSSDKFPSIYIYINFNFSHDMFTMIKLKNILIHSTYFFYFFEFSSEVKINHINRRLLKEKNNKKKLSVRCERRSI